MADYASAPTQVVKYLSPGEQPKIVLRQHPALLMPPLTAASGALLAALILDSIPHEARWAHIAVWLPTAFLVARSISLIFNWAGQYMVLTTERFMLFSGLINPTITTISPQQLRDLTFERSYGGTMLGYATLTIETGGKSHTIIDYVPFPYEVYLRVRDLSATR